MQAVCVFCGSNYGSDPAYEAGAQAFGQLLASKGIALVYGGGKVGLMGVIADTMLAAGGQVYGVIPESLVEKELAHTGLSKLYVVGSLHERKAKMAMLSDAFVALPGGLGTYEELFEVLSWAQLRLHDKPVGVLNTIGFFDPMLGMLDSAVRSGFMRAANRSLLESGDTPDQLMQALRQYQPQHIQKWLPRGAEADQ